MKFQKGNKKSIHDHLKRHFYCKIAQIKSCLWSFEFSIYRIQVNLCRAVPPDTMPTIKPTVGIDNSLYVLQSLQITSPKTVFPIWFSPTCMIQTRTKTRTVRQSFSQIVSSCIGERFNLISTRSVGGIDGRIRGI